MLLINSQKWWSVAPPHNPTYRPVYYIYISSSRKHKHVYSCFQFMWKIMYHCSVFSVETLSFSCTSFHSSFQLLNIQHQPIHGWKGKLVFLCCFQQKQSSCSLYCFMVFNPWLNVLRFICAYVQLKVPYTFNKYTRLASKYLKIIIPYNTHVQ